MLSGVMPHIDLFELDGAVVEAARRAKLISVKELGQRAGLSGRTVWLARNGRPIGLQSVRKLARALGVGASRLLASSAASENAGAGGMTRAVG